MGSVVKGVRLLVVLTFLVGMPVLALPPVADWCESQIYRTAPTTSPNVVEAPAPPAAIPVKEPESPAQPADREESMDALLAELRSLGVADYRLDEAPDDPDHLQKFRMVAEFRSEGVLPKRWQYTSAGDNPQAAVREVIRQILADREPQ